MRYLKSGVVSQYLSPTIIFPEEPVRRNPDGSFSLKARSLSLGSYGFKPPTTSYRKAEVFLNLFGVLDSGPVVTRLRYLDVVEQSASVIFLFNERELSTQGFGRDSTRVLERFFSKLKLVTDASISVSVYVVKTARPSESYFLGSEPSVRISSPENLDHLRSAVFHAVDAASSQNQSEARSWSSLKLSNHIKRIDKYLKNNNNNGTRYFVIFNRCGEVMDTLDDLSGVGETICLQLGDVAKHPSSEDSAHGGGLGAALRPLIRNEVDGSDFSEFWLWALHYTAYKDSRIEVTWRSDLDPNEAHNFLINLYYEHFNDPQNPVFSAPYRPLADD